MEHMVWRVLYAIGAWQETCSCTCDSCQQLREFYSRNAVTSNLPITTDLALEVAARLRGTELQFWKRVLAVAALATPSPQAPAEPKCRWCVYKTPKQFGFHQAIEGDFSIPCEDVEQLELPTVPPAATQELAGSATEWLPQVEVIRTELMKRFSDAPANSLRGRLKEALKEREIAERTATAITIVIRRPDWDQPEWREWVIGCIEDELLNIGDAQFEKGYDQGWDNAEAEAARPSSVPVGEQKQEEGV